MRRLVVPLPVSTLTMPASAQVPPFVTYSGRLTDGTGWGQSTVPDLVVTVYDAAEGGNVVFRGRHPGVPVVDGYFTVNLGMCSESGACIEDPADAGFPSTLPGQAWLSVAVDGGLELGPLQPIGSVPYAVTAGSVAGDGPPLRRSASRARRFVRPRLRHA